MGHNGYAHGHKLEVMIEMLSLYMEKRMRVVGRAIHLDGHWVMFVVAFVSSTFYTLVDELN